MHREERGPHVPLLRYFGSGPVDPRRASMLAAVRAKNTRPEICLRRAVFREGARFRCHAKDVVGRPDLVNRRAHLAVFVDGCFWHGCPKHFKPPRTRTEFWVEKIRRNQERRAAVLEQLTPAWNVLAFYECELKEDLDTCARKVVAFITSPVERTPGVQRPKAATKARPRSPRTAAPSPRKRPRSSRSP